MKFAHMTADGREIASVAIDLAAGCERITVEPGPRGINELMVSFDGPSSGTSAILTLTEAQARELCEKLAAQIAKGRLRI